MLLCAWEPPALACAGKLPGCCTVPAPELTRMVPGTSGRVRVWLSSPFGVVLGFMNWPSDLAVRPDPAPATASAMPSAFGRAIGLFAAKSAALDPPRPPVTGAKLFETFVQISE